MDQLLQAARHTFSDGQGMQRAVQDAIVGPRETVRPGLLHSVTGLSIASTSFQKLTYLVAIVSEGLQSISSRMEEGNKVGRRWKNDERRNDFNGTMIFSRSQGDSRLGGEPSSRSKEWKATVRATC